MFPKFSTCNSPVKTAGLHSADLASAFCGWQSQTAENAVVLVYDFIKEVENFTPILHKQ